MMRLIFFTTILFFLTACQSLFEGNKEQEELKKSNYVLQKGRFPDRLIVSELKPLLLKYYGSDSFSTGEDKLFQRLRRVEFVPRFSDESIVASCDSYEILSRDKIEDNLYKSSRKWYELRLLKDEFESEDGLNPRIPQLISSCLENELKENQPESLMTSLDK